MRKTVLFILTLHFLFIFGQKPEIVWEQCFNTDDPDYAHALCATEQGFMACIEIHDGEWLPNYHFGHEILVIHYDSIGAVLWQKCYGGSKRDIPAKIVAAGDDTYFIYGKTKSTDGDVQSGIYGGYDLWVIKIDPQGDILWEQTYGSPGYETPKDMIILDDGGFLLLAETDSDGGDISAWYGEVDIWLCRCDAAGNIMWEKSIGTSGEERGSRLSVNHLGHIMLAATVYESGGAIDCTLKGESDIWIAEIGQQGELIWQQCYGGTDTDAGYQITDMGEGYIILASTQSSDGDISGIHTTNNFPKSDIWVAQTDYEGSILWSRCLGGNQSETPASITQISDNGYVVAGYTYSNSGDVLGNHFLNENTSDIWLVKLTSGGYKEWQRCYGGVNDESLKPFGLLVKEDYQYWFAGMSYGSSGDVSCIFGDQGIWVAELKRCPGYEPGIPELPPGPDTVYSASHPVTTFFVPPPANAWTMNWKLDPDTAGVLTNYGFYSKVDWAYMYSGTVAVSAQSSNYCGVSQWSEPRVTTVIFALGVDEQVASVEEVQVYPNPADDYVIFEAENYKETTTIKIMNIFGEEIKTIVGNSGKTDSPSANLWRTRWDCRNIQSGIYFYSVEFEGKVLSGKVVVQK